MKLTLTEQKIIDLLTLDEDLRFAHLARKIRISQNLFSHYVEKLERKNVIKDFQIVTNQDQSKVVFLTFLRLSGEKSSFSLPEFSVRFVEHFFGEYDVVVAKEHESYEEYYAFLKQIIAQNDIANYSTLVETNGLIFNTAFSNKVARKHAVYNDVSYFPNDSVHSRILQYYKEHPRKSLLEIGQHLKISYPNLRKKVGELKKNIILGKRAVIDYNELGYDSYLILLNINPGSVEKLKTFAGTGNQIIRVTQTFGSTNMFVEVLAESHHEVNAMIEKVKGILGSDLFNFSVLHKLKRD